MESAAEECGATAEDFQPAIQILKKEWRGNVGLLKTMNQSDWKKTELPEDYIKIIKEKLNEVPEPQPQVTCPTHVNIVVN